MDLEWMILLGSSIGYISVGMAVYRSRYIETYKDYRRWQIESDAFAMFYSSDEWRPPQARPRGEFTYPDYMRCRNLKIPPGALGMLWLFVAIFHVSKKILRPEVNMPDYPKLSKLEKDLNDIASHDSLM